MRLILLLVTSCSTVVESLRCYCTEDHCTPYGSCEGDVCLVGILRDNNQVIRTCGARQIGCHRDEDDKWTDLCACGEPYCNTFAYLRAHTSNRRDTGPSPDEIPLVFSRMDRPDDEPPPPAAPISTKTSLLTLLLVVVPLSVGAATVLPSTTTVTSARDTSSLRVPHGFFRGRTANSKLWHPKSRRLHVVLLLSLSYFCSSLIVANFGLNLTCMVVDHPRNISSSKCLQSESTSKNHVYKGTLDWSRHQEDLLLSATSWGSLVAQLPSMWIARRIPAKLVLLLVMVAHVLFNGLIPVVAVHVGYSSVFVLRVLIGVSHAFIDVAIYTLIDKWFPRFERSTALAVFAVGGQLAGIVGGPLTGAVCGSSIGWQFNFYLTSGIGCVFCVLWQLFSAESPRSARGISKTEQRFLLEHVHVEEKPTGSVPYSKIMLSLAVLAEFQMNFGTCVAQTITQSFFPQFFKEQVMISPVMNGYFTAIPNLCSFIVRLAWSTGVDLLKKRDHLGPTASTKISQAISSLGISMLFLVMAFFVGCNDPGVALAVASLIAVCQSLESAGHITSLLSLAPHYTESLSAMSMFFSQSARLATPYAVNALRNYERHGWEYVFIMASGVSLISGTIFVSFGSGVEQEWAKTDSKDDRKEAVIEETTRI